MSTPTAWAHLPNAHHIDWVLASLRANPQAWSDARDAAWPAAQDDARTAAWNAARTAARVAALNAAWGAARGATWGAAWDAIAALVAWDDCAYLFDLPLHAVQWIADKGDDAAVLLLPACTVHHSLNSLITGE